MSLLDNLPHLATAKRRSRTKDAMGGSIDTFTEVVFTDMPCWRQPATDREVLWWQQRAVDITHKVLFADDPELNENCVLEIDGDLLDVKSYASPDASVGLGVCYRIMAQLVRKL